MSNSKLLALVKWVGGVDHGKYTAGISVDWIRDFNYEKFVNEPADPDRSDIIEWREPRKKPKGGWELFDAVVIHVSKNRKELENMLKLMDAEVTKTPSGLNQVSTAKADDEKMKIQETNDENEEQMDTTREKEKEGPILEDIMYAILKVSTKQEELERKLDELLEIGKAKRAAAIEREFNPRNVQREDGEGRRIVQENEQEREFSKYEIGCQGSGVLINESQWMAINRKITPTSMAVALLLAIFPMEILLKSNLKGGISKVSKTGEHFDALDDKKITAIKDHCKKKFPGQYNAAAIGIAINNKLGQLRRDFHAKE